MARRLALVTVVLTAMVAGCGGGANSAAGIVTETAKVRQDLGAIMDGVTDEASATDALPKVEGCVNKLNELIDKFNKAEKENSPDAMQRFKAQMSGSGRELEEHKGTLNERSPKAYAIIDGALSKLR